MKIIYKTRATSIGGRSGHSQLDDGSLGFDLAVPGSGKVGVNPEQLFAIGYAACFDSSLALIAGKMKKAVNATRTSVEVGMGPSNAGGFMLDIDLYVEVRGLPEPDAHELVEAAHRTCPYSNAVRNNVDVRLHVTVA